MSTPAPADKPDRALIGRATELRIAGLTYQEIGDEIGVSRTRAHKLVSRELDRRWQLSCMTADRARAFELERLDAVLRIAIDIARDTTARQDTRIKAIGQAVAISARRARLLGLDAPAKIAATDPTGTQAAVLPTDEQIADRLLEMAKDALRAEPA